MNSYEVRKVISRHLLIKDERKLWPASGRIVIASRGVWTWSLQDTVCRHALSNSCNKQDFLQPMWTDAGFSRQQHRFDSQWTKWHRDSTCFLPSLPFNRCSILNHLSSTVIILTLRRGCRSVNAETRVGSQVILGGISGEQSGRGTGLTPSTSFPHRQIHSINTPYSFIHLPITLYNPNNY